MFLLELLVFGLVIIMAGLAIALVMETILNGVWLIVSKKETQLPSSPQEEIDNYKTKFPESRVNKFIELRFNKKT